MSRYHWPSWCRTHRRLHVMDRKSCFTNKESRMARKLAQQTSPEVPGE